MLSAAGAPLLRSASVLVTGQRLLNCNRAVVCRVHRLRHPQLYPTTVVLSDGATITARYHEPRKIIKLPLDLSTLSEEERLVRLQRRKPKQKVVIEQEVEDSFDVKKYQKFWKR
ncbi:39S ribosomal protein L55, mitochondrial [Amphibalanus amphitrite]|uniref:39S ribosomal protein L55, mitochondrial n=2 Tax=Amphibalanus amphitrite TaxID=1232801 RepID=A0A6A4VWL7_AMPAM|nr:39S ribosomal protein L55, mitochondrial-like [Amphibalanus amphitrite]XP_043208798.1 39S ribosomal protein L55, mitochondrial-like [Amphibalanus amphitrite]KAF0294288.1 39S ribosomal protein L55, mitochondrial [Amphibalanus amphitrite]